MAEAGARPPHFRESCSATMNTGWIPSSSPLIGCQRLGIEVVPAEVRRAAEAATSVRAFQEAREAGIELLPRPEVGKPFEFSLTDSQGRAFRSAAFKGKVVLIDVWASWRDAVHGQDGGGQGTL